MSAVLGVCAVALCFVAFGLAFRRAEPPGICRRCDGTACAGCHGRELEDGR